MPPPFLKYRNDYETPAEYPTINGGVFCGAGARGMQSPSLLCKMPRGLPRGVSLPVLVFLIYTCTMIYRCRHKIYCSPGLTGRCCVIIFLLLIDNSLKVGLRQPYSGIFTIFLRGLLLSRLSALNTTGDFHQVKF